MQHSKSSTLDEEDTIDQIVIASRHAISIVIVGVGGRKFDVMERLDGDEKVLANKRKERVSRDIVQFGAHNGSRTTHWGVVHLVVTAYRGR